MSFRCPNCHEYRVLSDTCHCKRFECTQPWRGKALGNDWREVYAMDAQDAAENFAERCDCEGDYTIIRNGSTEIWVRHADEETTYWSIEAESIPTYRASQIEHSKETS